MVQIELLPTGIWLYSSAHAILRTIRAARRSVHACGLSHSRPRLTALAIAKRRSELHALSYPVQHPEDWSSVTLIPDPLFIAKTERAGLPETRLQDVDLKVLAPFIGPDLEVDANNCVVRAIKIYLNSSHQAATQRPESSFLSLFKPGHTEEIKPATMSSWVVKTVRYTYDNLPGHAACLFKVRAQDVYGPSPPAGMPYRRYHSRTY